MKKIQVNISKMKKPRCKLKFLNMYLLRLKFSTQKIQFISVKTIGIFTITIFVSEPRPNFTSFFSEFGTQYTIYQNVY